MEAQTHAPTSLFQETTWKNSQTPLSGWCLFWSLRNLGYVADRTDTVRTAINATHPHAFEKKKL